MLHLRRNSSLTLGVEKGPELNVGLVLDLEVLISDFLSEGRNHNLHVMGQGSVLPPHPPSPHQLPHAAPAGAGEEEESPLAVKLDQLPGG